MFYTTKQAGKCDHKSLLLIAIMLETMMTAKARWVMYFFSVVLQCVGVQENKVLSSTEAEYVAATSCACHCVCGLKVC